MLFLLFLESAGGGIGREYELDDDDDADDANDKRFCLLCCWLLDLRSGVLLLLGVRVLSVCFTVLGDVIEVICLSDISDLRPTGCSEGVGE